MKRRLRGAALRSVGPLAVEPVLPHVEIERAQVDAAEIVERVIDHVELVRVVGRAATPDEGAGLVQRPALEGGQPVVRHGIALRVEVVEVCEEKARGIADPPVRLDELPQDLLGDAHVLAVVLGRHPQA